MAIPVRLPVDKWYKILHEIDGKEEHEILKSIITEEVELLGSRSIRVSLPIMLTSSQRKTVQAILRR